MKTPAESLAISSRAAWIDAVRGLAIILVVVGHVIQFGAHGSFDYFSNPIFVFIYSFHMPLFALVSGYLAIASVRKYSLGRLFILRARGLLVPFVSWTVVGGGVLALAREAASGDINLGAAASAVITGFITPEASLWFLWVMFCCYVLLSVSTVVPGRCWLLVAVSIWLMVLLIPLDGVLAVAQLKWLYPFFLAGAVARILHRRLVRWERLYTFGAAAIFLGLLSQWQRGDSVYVSRMSVDGMSVVDVLFVYGYRYLVALAGAVAFVGIVRIVSRHFAMRWLLPLGAASLGIYAVQTYPVAALAVVPSPTSNPPLYFAVYVPAVAAAVVIGAYLVTFLFQRVRLLRVLFLGGR
ncbi:acyltransferase [Microbacterium testaceum]|uniref:acyltransferase family protein n=1 Tax=Microbacterium testaceum TaxID=2033 RepID=UPI00342D840F